MYPVASLLYYSFLMVGMEQKVLKGTDFRPNLESIFPGTTSTNNLIAFAYTDRSHHVISKTAPSVSQEELFTVPL